MESNNRPMPKEKDTIFTPLARGIKIKEPDTVTTLDGILSNEFKKHYFSEIKNKNNKN